MVLKHQVARTRIVHEQLRHYNKQWKLLSITKVTEVFEILTSSIGSWGYVMISLCLINPKKPERLNQGQRHRSYW